MKRERKGIASARVETRKFFNDATVPLFARKRAFADEMVLRVLFQGSRSANRWAKANRPRDWESESREESLVKELADARWRLGRAEGLLGRLRELRAPRQVQEGQVRVVAKAREKVSFLEGELSRVRG